MEYSKINEEKEDPRIDISDFYSQYKDDQGYIYFEPTIEFSFMSNPLMGSGIYEIICFKSPEPGRNYKTYPFNGKGDDFDVVFNYYYISDGKEEVVESTKSIKVLNCLGANRYPTFVEHLLEKIKERYPEFWEGKKFNFFESKRILTFEKFSSKYWSDDLKQLRKEIKTSVNYIFNKEDINLINKFWTDFVKEKKIKFDPPIKSEKDKFLGMESDGKDIYVRIKSPKGKTNVSLSSMSTKGLQDLIKGLQERYLEYFEAEKFNFF